jgi:hypothetical protein
MRERGGGFSGTASGLSFFASMSSGERMIRQEEREGRKEGRKERRKV